MRPSPTVPPHARGSKTLVVSIKDSRPLLALLFLVLLPFSAAAQGRPDVVWMRGGNLSTVSFIVFFSDGVRMASSSHSGPIKVWRVSDGVLLRTINNEHNGSRSLALSPNDQLLAAQSSLVDVGLYQTSDGALVRTINLGYEPERISFSPDGQTLLVAPYNSASGAKLFRVSDGTLLRQFSTGYDAVFTPDGSRVATVCGNPAFNLCFYSVSTGTLLNYIPNGGGSTAFSPGGQFVTNGAQVFLTSSACTPTNGCEPGQPTVVANLAESNTPLSVAFSPDGQTLASGNVYGGGAGSSGRISMWRVSDWSLIRSYEVWPTSGNNGPRIAFSPDSQTLAANRVGEIKLWSVAEGSVVRRITEFTQDVQAVAYSPDGQVLATGASGGGDVPDKTLKLWHSSDGTLLRASDIDSPVYSLAFSPDGQTLASAHYLNVKLWRISDGALLHTIFAGGAGSDAEVAFSPDGQLIAVGVPFKLDLYRTSDWGYAGSFPTWGATLAFSPDSQLLASSPDNGSCNVSLWRLSDMSYAGALDACTGNDVLLRSVAFSPDGQTIAVGMGERTFPNGVDTRTGGVKLFRTSDRALLWTVGGHEGWVNGVAFSPGGHAIMSVGFDRTIRVWRASDGSLLNFYDEETVTYGPGQTSVAFSPDGQFFAYGRGDATVVVAKAPQYTHPDLTLSKTHGGNFTVGRQGGYTLTVTNVGDGPSSGQITVTDTLPAGLSYVSASGTGWSCSASGQTVTCVTGNALAAAASSSIALQVAVLPEAVPPGSPGNAAQVTNAASVSGGGEANTSNNSATDPTAVSAVPAASLKLSPASLVGATKPVAGTVMLSAPAPAGGINVYLSTNNATVSVPPTVTVSGGATSATFTATTSPVASNTQVTITASSGGASKSATLTVQAPAPSSVTFSPSSVTGGQGSTGTVKINGPAPAGGLVVELSSNKPEVALPPPTVTVPEGQMTATFPVSTWPVAADTAVSISAKFNNVTKSGTLTVKAPVVLSLKLNPTAVNGGNKSVGTVTLTGAVAQGATLNVTLAGNNTAVAQVPATLTIPEGQTSGEFDVTTFGVSAQITPIISAQTGTIKKEAKLTVKPAALLSLTFNSASTTASVTGGTTATVTATLAGVAPAAGATVTLSSNNAAAGVPANVVIPGGQSSATFPVTTSPVAANVTATITGTYAGLSKTGKLTVLAPVLDSLAPLNPDSVVGGGTSTGTVTLTGPAPAAGTTVALKSSNTAVATVPANVVVAAGQTSANFTVTTKVVASNTNVTITATKTTSKTATLSVTTAPPQCAGPAGLVAWWKAEGDALDSAGASHGTLINSATFGAGKVSQAFSFDGADDYVALPDNLFPLPASGGGNAPFSFEVWFKTTANGVILGQQDSAPGPVPVGFVPALYVGTDGRLRAQMFWNNFASPMAGGTVVSDGAFHHAAVTYDGATQYLYLDGVLIASRAHTHVDYATTYKYQLGTGYTGGWSGGNSGWFPFAGLIDDPSLYSRTLTAAEVKAIYDAGAAGKCGGYDAAADFNPASNPSGAWSYGYYSGSAFTPATLQATNSDGTQAWYEMIAGGGPYLIRNPTGAAVSAYCGGHQPAELHLDPSFSGLTTVARWTAPAVGTYQVYARFRGINTATVTTHVYHNGASLHAGELTGGCGDPTIQEQTLTVTAAAGDTVDFAVGSDGSVFSDSTGVVARVTRQ
jgi:uncharacterized repeat protein (TIGR01451 family)